MQSIIFTSVQATTVFNVVVSLPVMPGYKEQSLLSGLLRSFLCVCHADCKRYANGDFLSRTNLKYSI